MLVKTRFKKKYVESFVESWDQIRPKILDKKEGKMTTPQNYEKP